ncbi:hypothetical protein BT67DRAFT_238724 [Trichocladium antarcticum]|uniref:Uncharacterized protein n=1 Tax=Trichocladium antarcticum TaxID=1450529 RepID=A0AAN6UEJ7_9PEZI|nr:hypothetical protein BT67DRAFT_238724 [Trichocladium antarcticum]
MVSSWLRLLSCCGADEKPRTSESSLGLVPSRVLNSAGTERNIVVLRDQPAVIPRPSAEALWSSEKTYEKTLEQEGKRDRERARLRKLVSRDSTAVRESREPGPSSSARRLHISGPTDFRHLQSESFQFPPPVPAPRPRPRSFRPIELSIYQPHNRLSAILPHLDNGDDIITHPPRAYTGHSSRWDASSPTATNDRSCYSTLSFHIPRKHVRQGSGMSDAGMSPPRTTPSTSPPRVPGGMSPPAIPPKSRARAYTAPATKRIVERIASALIEKERLQTEINTVVARQSIYFGSRPSSGCGLRGTSAGPRTQARALLTHAAFEPMPSIPAMPAAGPSFAERLSVDGRPRTAPSRASSAAIREKTLELAAAAQACYSPTRYDTAAEHDDLERPLAPPLPLVLRPPLRKKKSFSRVSNWLFHPDDKAELAALGDNNNNNTADSSPTAIATSITTSPRPIKASDGFYQCVAPPEGLPRTSMETSSSVYTWATNDDDDDDETEAKTLPTTAAAWSPEQTPKQASKENTPVVGAAGPGVRKSSPVFGSKAGFGGAGGLGVDMAADAQRPLSVGVAI